MTNDQAEVLVAHMDAESAYRLSLGRLESVMDRVAEHVADRDASGESPYLKSRFDAMLAQQAKFIDLQSEANHQLARINLCAGWATGILAAIAVKLIWF